VLSVPVGHSSGNFFSPMVDSKVQVVADKLGIEVYSDSIDVKNL